MSLTFGARGFAATALALSMSSVWAQGANVFGATIRNPGSVVSEWWNERAYIPEQLDGAMHLRVGSAGSMNGNAQLGRTNCDLAYLYAAKSGKALTEAELDACAVLEFDIKRGIDGDRRNMEDGFARKDILAEMRPGIQKRIEQMRAAQLFYFRSAFVNIDAFDFAKKSFPMRMSWQGGTVGNPATAHYQFEGDGFFANATPNWFQFRLGSDEASARITEGARMGNGSIPAALNRVLFTVDGTRESGRPGAPPTRFLTVKLKSFKFVVRDAKGNAYDHEIRPGG